MNNPPTSSERRACEVNHSIPPSTIHLPPIPAILPFEDSRIRGLEDSRIRGFEDSNVLRATIRPTLPR